MNNSYYNVSHSRDYYKGKSVEFAGEWTSGVRYFNDEYLNSLVVYTEKDATGNIIHSALLACKKTHIAAYNNSIPDSTNNQPHLVINDNLGVIGIEPNDYWIFVSGSLMGTPGKSAEIVNTYLEAVTLATENNISKIVFVKEEKSIYFIVDVGELRKIVSTSDFSELFESKVDKEPGKGLSTNDYSNSEKEKLEGIEENAQRNIIEEIDLNGVKIEPVNKVVSINVDTEVTENSNNLVTSGAVHKKLDLKQDQLIPGDNITIQDNVISATNNVDLSDYAKTEDVNKKLDTKQNTLIAGNGIKIENNKIDITPITESETQPNTSIWVNPTENTEVELTYNRSQIDTLISSKQDVIDDIDNIRRGAAKGASSLQSETDPIYTADKPNLALKSEIPDISVKVDKEEGKGLSSNDYTNAEKAKLASLENYNDTEIKELINQKVNDTDLAKVAKTGKYSDLIDEPLIKSSQAPTNNEPLWVNPDEDQEEVEVYNRSQVDALLNTKQNTLIPGNGIIIDGNVISSTGGGESGGSIDLSSYAKKTDVETALAGKQDVISDLADIKEGANKGKTALQSYNETDPVYTADKPTLALKSELATKQNKLTAGNGISIENNKIGVTAITESESQPSTHLWVNPSEDAETNVTYNRSQIDALVGAKQDTLQLTVKDNGNIVLANLQGQSKEFMPATPSGDPMHYAYEVYGCVWNGDEDRQVATPWAEYADNEEDKIVIHKKGCWLLNGIGDLTTNEMRKICARGLWNSNDRYALGYTVGMNSSRTLLYRVGEQNGILEQNVSGYNSVIISINLSISSEENKLANLNLNSIQNYFISSTSLKYIFGGILNVNNVIPNAFKNCVALRICRIKTKKNLYLGDSPYFNNYCIRYAIENNLATENITITLHPDAYARAIANADIVAALEAHPNVSLASA